MTKQRQAMFFGAVLLLVATGLLIVAGLRFFHEATRICLRGHYETHHYEASCTCQCYRFGLGTSTMHPEHDEREYICDEWNK